jgi:serine O-acetyltransferase
LNRSTHSYLAVVPRAERDESDDLIWQRLRREAEQAYDKAPALATLFFDSIINQPSFEAAVCHRVSSRLKNDVVALPLIVQAFHRALSADPAIGCAFKADLAAVVEKDPACDRFIEPFLYFKGFHAIQSQRVTHWLWNNGERDFALYLQSRASEVFQTDIHPAARFGQGIFLDHATGLVVGETAVVEDDVSLLQDVTLGGTGKEAGDRHPKVRRGVMIGAGAKVRWCCARSRPMRWWLAFRQSSCGSRPPAPLCAGWRRFWRASPMTASTGPSDPPLALFMIRGRRLI